MTQNLSFLDWPFAVLTFDQVGSKVNVLSQATWNDFGQALEEVSQREGVEGLILMSGKPGIFIAGADLKEFEHASPDHPEPTRAFLELGHRVLNQLESLPFPTIALIDGACLGGGLEVALACDYRLAGTHPKVQLGFPEVLLGLIPGWGGTQRLSRIRDPLVALGLICSAQNYSAEQALAEQLVSEIVPSEHLLIQAKEWLSRSRADGSWQTIRQLKREPVVQANFPTQEPEGDKMFLESIKQYTRQLEGPPRTASLEAVDVIFRGASLPLDSALRIETAAFLRLAGSEESKRMIEAFFAKRK